MSNGWKVLSIPFFEWDVLASKDAQKAYIERKLSSVRT